MLPNKIKRTERLVVMLSREEIELVVRAANKLHIDTSNFIRFLLCKTFEGERNNEKKTN